MLSVLWLMSILAWASALWAGEPRLRQAHAHNDYEHSRPLLDALEQGFGSVEADVHLAEGRLLVGHDPEDLSPEKTLESLYLGPLRDVLAGAGPNPAGSLILLIDLKTEADKTYAALKPLLGKYAGILTRFESSKIHTNAVTVILSGNRPREVLLGEPIRYAAFDGRLADLGQNLPASFMPLVSDNWNNHFSWKGTGPFPAAEKAKLAEVVRKVHSEGRQLRFWATPDTVAAWRVLREAGVDLINTDDLAGLARFLRSPED